MDSPNKRRRPNRREAPLPTATRRYICLGLEGSANKFGAGIIAHSPPSDEQVAEEGSTEHVEVLSNVRHTYVTPPGQGFLPSDTARHHKAWCLRIIKQAVADAGIEMGQVDCIAYTKGETHSLRVIFFMSISDAGC